MEAGKGHGNPLDESGLCLLSLDGGGVRGLSTLYILKVLMKKINKIREKENLASVKPCEVFDLMGGTSTGGLIAIMLGRLEMDVDECIKAYTSLMVDVFDKRTKKFVLGFNGKVRGRFDSKVLATAITKVIRSRNMSETDLFYDGVERKCRVFVCATAQELHRVVPLRSYDLDDGIGVEATILEAALATSAATGFFEPVQIGARLFVDGAWNANNPSFVVEDEASRIWPSASGSVRQQVKCFLSVGTGTPGLAGIEKSPYRLLRHNLIKGITDTATVETNFLQSWQEQYNHHRYFRFNVLHGLQNVSLHEAKEQGKIEAVTDEYLRQLVQQRSLSTCAANLKMKRYEPSSGFAAIIQEYNQQQIILSRATPSTRETRWFVPFKRNPRFVGRTKQLDELTSSLFRSGQCSEAALWGLGGVGKTQAALELAYQTRDKRPDYSVFWVAGASSFSFENSCSQICRQLGLATDADTNTDVKQLLCDHLSQDVAGKWLLIIDNADDIDAWFKRSESEQTRLIDFIPRSDNGSILFTTRNRKLAARVAQKNMIEVLSMDADMGIKFLEACLFKQELLQDRDTTLLLLQKLTFLPLALSQAVAYINENGISFKEYLDLLMGAESDVVALLCEGFDYEERHNPSSSPVASTWLVSYRQIRQRDHLAADYLCFMACVDPQNIPKSLLPPADGETTLLEAITTLTAYSFITRRPFADDTEETYDVHRLVHLTTRNWLKLDRLLQPSAIAAIDRVASMIPERTYSERARFRNFLPHIMCAVRTGMYFNQDTAGQILIKIGNWFAFEGYYNSAVHMLRELLEWRLVRSGGLELENLSLLNDISEALLGQGSYAEAEKMAYQVLQGRRMVLSEGHHDIVISLANLGAAILRQGKWRKAERILKEALAEATKATKEQQEKCSWATLGVMSYLARLYVEKGRLDDAERLLLDILEVRGRHEDASGPGTLVCKSQLSTLYIAQGRLNEAEELCLDIHEVQLKILGPKHPERLAILVNLAQISLEHGRLDEAEALIAKVRKRGYHLGENHVINITALEILVSTYTQQGKYVEALELNVQCLDHAGSGDLDLARLLRHQCRTATVNLLLGFPDDVVKPLESYALSKHAAVLGADHPDHINAMSLLARAYWMQFRKDVAIALMMDCVALGDEKLGAKHPSTVRCWEALEQWRADFEMSGCSTGVPVQRKSRHSSVGRPTSHKLSLSLRHTSFST